MKKIRAPLALATLCFFAACINQPTAVDLFQRLKKPAFVAPSPQVQKRLHIPFLENGSYGLCDYAGKMLLKPQFEDIEMPAFDLPFVKAKKNGGWSLYDFSGKQILPYSVQMPHLLNIELDFKTAEGYDYHFMAKVREPEMSYLKPWPKPITDEKSSRGIEAEVKPESAPRFYYFTKNTKPPLRSWFAPNDLVFYDFSRRTGYNNQVFTSSVFRGFWKVMDENWRFTLLDKNMVPLFPPVFNCATISPTKVLILNENGLCALRDVKKGWQTDFKYIDVKATDNPDICLASARGADKPLWYIVDGNGKLTSIDSPEDYHPINERYSRIAEKSGEYQKRYYLFDEKTGRKVRELKNWHPEKIFETGFGILNGSELIGIETLAGDTIRTPAFPNYITFNDSTYTFVKGDTVGLANRQNEVLFQTKGSGITDYGDGFFQVYKEEGKLFGIVRADGRVILPVEFDQIYPMRSANRFLVRKNGLWGLFDWETGAEILPLQFNYLRPNGYPFWYGGGVEIRSNAGFFILSPDLEVVHQDTKKPILTKKDFPLKNASETAKADFEKTQMPMYCTPYMIFKGPNWLHIFRCDGGHIASLEGFKDFEMTYIRSTESNGLLDKAALTGVAKLTSISGNTVWVRLEDGFLYQK